MESRIVVANASSSSNSETGGRTIIADVRSGRISIPSKETSPRAALTDSPVQKNA